MPVSQILCPECGALMPIKPGRRKQTVKCPECGEKLDVAREPGAMRDPEAGPPAVGSSVTSFESESPDELAARRKRRGNAFGGGEFGGLGDLLFNPMGGQPAAMNGLGAGASFLIALVLLGFLVGFSWFLPLFIGWMRDPAGWFLKDVIAQVPLGAHLGLAASGVILPLVLFLIFGILNVLFFQRCTGTQLLLTTMMVFVPFLILFAILAVGLVNMATLRDIAISLNEVFGDGIFSDNENYRFRVSLWFVALAVLYTVIHPVLLVFASLRSVVGFSDRGAFFVTPLVVGLSVYFSQFIYWAVFEKWNLFGVADAFSEVF